MAITSRADDQAVVGPFVAIPPQSMVSAKLIALALAGELRSVLERFESMAAAFEECNPEYFEEMMDVFYDADRVLAEFDDCCRDEFETCRERAA